ncbi:MAG TPA: hypothetical protein VHM91_24190 [Verrucomicrobiales bacterium]|jgi:uncharacterized membrane protein|nr:hypothetical protein [Verrucomicrobiales bacterium]
MLGLTSLGIVHTAISLVAVAAGLVSLVRDREISTVNGRGKLYVLATVITCLTGFGIFQHGGFGKPHVLGIITLLVLGVAGAAEKTRYFGRFSRYVAAVSYSATFFFHMIPAMTETTTRLPVGAPLVADRDGPELEAAAGVLFLLFLTGAALQIRMLKKSTETPGAEPEPLSRRSDIYANLTKPRQ